MIFVCDINKSGTGWVADKKHLITHYNVNPVNMSSSEVTTVSLLLLMPWALSDLGSHTGWSPYNVNPVNMSSSWLVVDDFTTSPLKLNSMLAFYFQNTSLHITTNNNCNGIIKITLKCLLIPKVFTVVKLKRSRWLYHQCNILSMQQLIQMLSLFHWIFIMTMGMQSCHRTPLMYNKVFVCNKSWSYVMHSLSKFELLK